MKGTRKSVIWATSKAETSLTSAERRNISRKSIIAVRTSVPANTASTAERKRHPKYRDSVPVIMVLAPSRRPCAERAAPLVA